MANSIRFSNGVNSTVYNEDCKEPTQRFIRILCYLHITDTITRKNEDRLAESSFSGEIVLDNVIKTYFLHPDVFKSDEGFYIK